MDTTDTLQLKKKLAKFISFNRHPHSPVYNTINSIVSSDEIIREIQSIAKLLRLEPAYIEYSEQINLSDFIRSWAKFMIVGKTTFMFVNKIPFHPVIFDQFITFRQRNSFNPIDQQYGKHEWVTQNIHNEAYLFLVFNQIKDSRIQPYIYEVSDHVLDVRQHLK